MCIYKAKLSFLLPLDDDRDSALGRPRPALSRHVGIGVGGLLCQCGVGGLEGWQQGNGLASHEARTGFLGALQRLQEQRVGVTLHTKELVLLHGVENTVADRWPVVHAGRATWIIWEIARIVSVLTSVLFGKSMTEQFGCLELLLLLELQLLELKLLELELLKLMTDEALVLLC